MELATGSYLNELVVSYEDGRGIEHTPTAGVDEATDGGRGYIAERDRQNSALLRPRIGARGKLPDLLSAIASMDVESAQDVELVIEDT